MAVSVKQYQGGRVARPQQVVGVQAGQTGAEAAARGMQAVGDLFYAFQDEVDTADAKVADARFAKVIQDAFYADGSGYMYADGANATSRREGIVKGLEKERDTILGGLSPAARARAEAAIIARSREAQEQANRHAMTQGKEYLRTASEARISTFVSDAVYNPQASSVALARAQNDIEAMGQEFGWAPEVVALKVKEARTQAHYGIATRLANADPVAAMDYLAANKDDMDGMVVAKLEGQLAPIAKEHRGRRAGQAAAAGVGIPKYEYSTQFDFQMGPKRPNKPNDAVVNVIGKAAEDAFGKGARVVITSGQEDDGHQHGSARHKTGMAADIKVIRPDGSVVKSSDPDAPVFAVKAAELGAQGIGFGGEYMGGDHFHIDLLEPESVGGGHVWASGGKAHADAIVNAIKGRKTSAAGGLQSLLDIQDPTEREAALGEYRLRKGIETKALEEMRTRAQEAAFLLIENGQSISSLTLAQREVIGQDGMSSLRTYQDKLATGQKVVTDDYQFVKLMELSSSDPGGFAKIDPLTYRNYLSDSDFKSMVSRRSSIIEGARPDRDPIKLTEARAALSTVLDAAGIDASKPAGAKVKAKAEAEMLRWGSQFVAENGRQPSAVEVNKRAAEILTPVVINPPGAFNEQTGSAVTINYQGKPVTGAGEITTDQLPLSTILIGGTKVPPADVQLFIEAYTAKYGGAPTPQEVVEGLIGSGEYGAR